MVAEMGVVRPVDVKTPAPLAMAPAGRAPDRRVAMAVAAPFQVAARAAPRPVGLDTDTARIAAAAVVEAAAAGVQELGLPAGLAVGPATGAGDTSPAMKDAKGAGPGARKQIVVVAPR